MPKVTKTTVKKRPTVKAKRASRAKESVMDRIVPVEPDEPEPEEELDDGS